MNLHMQDVLLNGKGLLRAAPLGLRIDNKGIVRNLRCVLGWKRNLEFSVINRQGVIIIEVSRAQKFADTAKESSVADSGTKLEPL